MYVCEYEGEHGQAFPTEKPEVLSYFAARLEEHAARTVFRSLLNLFRFFVEAGEVPPALRLTADQSLEGAAREYERKRRQRPEGTGEKTGKHQALQMPLTVLVALEHEVSQESKPLFIRAYSWYRFLRH